MAAVCMAQHQHQGLGYCQNLLQPDSEGCFHCLVTFWTEDALTAFLQASTTAFPQQQENSLGMSASPSRWLSPSGKFCIEGIWINYERLPVLLLSRKKPFPEQGEIKSSRGIYREWEIFAEARLIAPCCLNMQVRARGALRVIQATLHGL